MGRQPHSEACRSRFEELLKGEARFQNAERKRKEFEEKMKEKAAKKSRKEESKRLIEEAGQRRPGDREGQDEAPAKQPWPADNAATATSSSPEAASASSSSAV